jgi:hypothetical protein
MGMEKFTPGPWLVFEGCGDDRPGIDTDEGFSVVIFGDCEDQVDDGGIFGRTTEEAIANAHLIAAAPEMYAALKHAQQNMPHPDQMIDDALAKAMGEVE